MGHAESQSSLAKLQQRAEEWIYRLNEQNHWIFRLYDWGNEIWSSAAFPGVRRRARELDVTVESRGHVARVRFLSPSDLDDFAELLGGLDPNQYLPPHPLDRLTAERALSRRSYIPIGIYVGERMIGYILLRLFFPRRVVTGIWMLADTHNTGLGRHTLLEAVKFLRAERLANYCTIPVDNEPSLRIALWCGWKIVRTNSRFHVLLQ